MALGVAFVVAAGAAIWLASSSGGGETATQPGSDDATTAQADVETDEDLATEADELRELLQRLGLDGVDVDVRGPIIYLDGVVPSEQDLSTVRTAVLNSTDPASIDMSGVLATGPGYEQQDVAAPGPGDPPPPPPGSPPPGFRPPTAEQQENLQRELNRALTDTPLVFDLGSTSLNERQLELLDSVIIGLLEAHPGVPVRLLGYTDESGNDFDNSLLSFDRASAVRDYLISRGVPDFIVRAEGRGEEDASGDPGADRRVEIEVISNPLNSSG